MGRQGERGPREEFGLHPKSKVSPQKVHSRAVTEWDVFPTKSPWLCVKNGSQGARPLRRRPFVVV